MREINDGMWSLPSNAREFACILVVQNDSPSCVTIAQGDMLSNIH